MAMNQGLTDEEQALIRLVGQFARDFAELPQLHPADMQEVAFHVHALARIVGMRAAHRAHPDLVPNRAGTHI
jgi:mRNA-degrading endonuclease YafQ of YafQ-DinJ toxin-antitoxin module